MSAQQDSGGGSGGKQQNTAYGVFVQACWAQHKRQYPDELIHKEIEEFNKQCSVWWYNLSEQERERFQEMADRSNNAAALASQQTSQQQLQQNAVVQNYAQQQQLQAATQSAVLQQQLAQQQQMQLTIQNAAVSSSAAGGGGIPSFGSSFNYTATSQAGTAGGDNTTYGLANGHHLQGGQVVNAVVDNTGTVLNYSTNAAALSAAQQQGLIQQRVIGANGLIQTTRNLGVGGNLISGLGGQQQQLLQSANSGQGQVLLTTAAGMGGLAVATQNNHLLNASQQFSKPAVTTPGGKPPKDPNAPKKPLSAYFLFSSDERGKVKAENPDWSITDIAKALGKRWAVLDPAVKSSYEQRYQESRRTYDSAMNAYKPAKKKKDPNAPKQPLSAYFLFSSEERAKVKEINPTYTICDVAKELGRRWADMPPDVKQRYQQMAEEGRQRYDRDMAAYRQNSFTANASNSSGGARTPTSSSTIVHTNGQTAAGIVTTAAITQQQQHLANPQLTSSIPATLLSQPSVLAAASTQQQVASTASIAAAAVTDSILQGGGGASNGVASNPSSTPVTSVVGGTNGVATTVVSAAGGGVGPNGAVDYASLLQ